MTSTSDPADMEATAAAMRPHCLVMLGGLVARAGLYPPDGAGRGPTFTAPITPLVAGSAQVQLAAVEGTVDEIVARFRDALVKTLANAATISEACPDGYAMTLPVGALPSGVYLKQWLPTPAAESPELYRPDARQALADAMLREYHAIDREDFDRANLPGATDA